MNRYLRILKLLLCCFLSSNIYAQGPPILGDKPIMLGAKRVVLRTLSEFRQLSDGWAIKTPAMVHYLPTSNTLLGLYVPLVISNRANETQAVLGDISLVTKYQFYRNDGTGKTFRIVAKGVQNIPTGAQLNLDNMSMGIFQSYWSVVAGYESIKYGIASELGYNFSPVAAMNDARLKLGFGLPLLKPTYPVRQINLFFEYQANYWTATQEYLMLYAQGLQYATGQLTIEAAFQWPLWQKVPLERTRLYSVYLGFRYVI
jgi:hypothetical protein